MDRQLQLEDVWADYRARIKAFLHARVSDPEDVEDLLQDISIKVFDGLAGKQLTRDSTIVPSIPSSTSK